MSIEDGRKSSLDQVGDIPLTLQVLLGVAAAVGVEPEISVPVTKEELMSQGFEMYPPAGIELNGSKSRIWNTESPFSDQEILNLLGRERIEFEIIKSGRRQLLYIKYPETQSTKKPGDDHVRPTNESEIYS